MFVDFPVSKNHVTLGNHIPMSQTLVYYFPNILTKLEGPDVKVIEN